jgi:hypothetical protein
MADADHISFGLGIIIGAVVVALAYVAIMRFTR